MSSVSRLIVASKSSHALGWAVFLAVVEGGINSATSLVLGLYLTESNTENKVLLAIWMGALIVAQSLASLLATILFKRFQSAIVHSLRTFVMSSLLGNNIEYFNLQHSGDVAGRSLANSIAMEGLANNILEVVRTGCTFATSIILIGYYAPYMIIAVLGGIIFTTSLILLLVKRLRRVSSARQGLQSQMGKILGETIQNIRVIKIFGNSDFLQARFNEQSSTAENKSKSIANFRALISFFSYFLMGASGTLLLILQLYGQLQIDNGSLVTVYLCILNAFKNGATVLFCIAENTKYTTLVTKTEEMVDNKLLAKTAKDKQQIDTPQKIDQLAYSNVSFSHGPTEVLKKISVQMKKGDVVALVGPSGSGKTTFTSLLLGFYAGYQGSIRINEHELKDFRIEDIGSKISWVPQDNMLFSTTIMQNFKMANPIASLQDVETASKLAQCHDFIMELPEGYQTAIGEKGLVLSGGQKQRIAIAIALLRQSEVLILDEATSALDTETERLIQDAIEKTARDRITIIIAHRLSTIRKANRILVFSKGVIVEDGNHEELMKSQGLYEKLVSNQQIQDFIESSQEGRSARSFTL